MVKRMTCLLLFVVAFSVVGLAFSNQAQAWRGGYYWGPRYYSAYYAPRVAYYPPVVPYRAYYYGPRVIAPYGYYAYPAYPTYYYYGPPAGVSVSVGL